MAKSLFPEDDALPTWLHTFALFACVSLLALPLMWWGFGAIFNKYLEPISGPEFGQYLFGRKTLQGSAATWAGISLLLWALNLYALAARFTRMWEDIYLLRWAPWAILIISIFIGYLAEHIGAK